MLQISSKGKDTINAKEQVYLGNVGVDGRRRQLYSDCAFYV